MSKSAREKKKYFICPLCGIKHKIVKLKEEAIVLIQCDCGCGSFIQTKNGIKNTYKERLKKILEIKNTEVGEI